jgi:hypothetical protein
MSIWDDELINQANERNAGRVEAKEVEVDMSLGVLRAAGLSDLSPGVHYLTCPDCDEGKGQTTLKVTRSAADTEWKWRCHYCGASGETKNWREDYDDDQEWREQMRRLGLRIWEQSEPLGTSSSWLAEVYFSARGIEPPPDHHAVLRWQWQCPFGKDERLPCIVALLRSVITDQPTGAHLIHVVSAKHGEAKRMTYGDCIGSAIKLWPLARSEDLTVGEGIENVLAAIKLGQARPPAWAMTVANNLGRLPVIPQVKRLTILADNDRSTTGERKARECRRAWRAAGKAVTALMTTEVGSDFNDLLKGDDHEG